MLEIVLEIKLATKFVVAEMFLEFRNIVLEVLRETLRAFIAALYK